jgi:adenylylsulfate kinase-like enzyme
MTVPVLLITGPVGVGKSTIALEVSNLLERVGTSHAVVDLDALGWAYSSPPDDPYNTRLALRNLAAVWANYAAIGVERLVIAYVVETHAELDAYREAIPGAELTIVRLRAASETLREPPIW